MRGPEGGGGGPSLEGLLDPRNIAESASQGANEASKNAKSKKNKESSGKEISRSKAGSSSRPVEEAKREVENEIPEEVIK